MTSKSNEIATVPLPICIIRRTNSFQNTLPLRQCSILISVEKIPTRPDKLNRRPNTFQRPMTAMHQDNASQIQPIAIIAYPKSNSFWHTSPLHQWSIVINAEKMLKRPDKLNQSPNTFQQRWWQPIPTKSNRQKSNRSNSFQHISPLHQSSIKPFQTPFRLDRHPVSRKKKIIHVCSIFFFSTWQRWSFFSW